MDETIRSKKNQIDSNVSLTISCGIIIEKDGKILLQRGAGEKPRTGCSEYRGKRSVQVQRRLLQARGARAAQDGFQRHAAYGAVSDPPLAGGKPALPSDAAEAVCGLSGRPGDARGQSRRASGQLRCLP